MAKLSSSQILYPSKPIPRNLNALKIVQQIDYQIGLTNIVCILASEYYGCMTLHQKPIDPELIQTRVFEFCTFNFESFQYIPTTNPFEEKSDGFTVTMELTRIFLLHYLFRRSQLAMSFIEVWYIT